MSVITWAQALRYTIYLVFPAPETTRDEGVSGRRQSRRESRKLPSASTR